MDPLFPPFPVGASILLSLIAVSPDTTNHPWQYQLLPQTVYTAPNPAAAPDHVVNFTTPLGLGVNLQQAYMGTADSLLLAHEPAFSPDM